jgi:hypothetical protein
MSVRPGCLAVLLLLVAFWVGAALTIGWATGGGSCRHGESSVRAWRDARGRMRVSRPHLTGCLPPGWRRGRR